VALEEDLGVFGECSDFGGLVRSPGQNFQYSMITRDVGVQIAYS